MLWWRPDVEVKTLNSNGHVYKQNENYFPNAGKLFCVIPLTFSLSTVRDGGADLSSTIIDSTAAMICCA